MPHLEITSGERSMFAADLMQIKERRELVIAIILLAAVTLLGLFLDNVVLVIAPIIALLAYISLRDIRVPYFFLFAMIPISWEQELGGGFGTDLPTEPMMVILMGLAFLYLLRRGKYINAQAILHPITLFLLLHYAWIWASSIWSELMFVSIKWSLAKTWYISVFFLLSMFLLRTRAQIQALIKIVLWSLVIVTIIILIRHAQKDFSFESANFVMAPFFRNHVTSAALMSLLVPFCVLLFMNTKHFLMRVLYVFAFVILILGAYFSYTRAAHISLILSCMIIPIVRYRLIKHTLIIVAIAMVWLTSNIISENKYLGLAPDFETTVSHTTFDDLVNATYQGKDISTMERIYRWVAGYQMIKRKPYLGFGPGSFFYYYKSYTVTLFRTYVSDNPEKSGIHCYYLMILTEQGFIGLAIFLLMVAVVLMSMESVYHRLTDPMDRRILMTFIVSFIIILLFQLINDLIETDKMGPFFFLAMAITVIYDLKSRGEEVINISE